MGYNNQYEDVSEKESKLSFLILLKKKSRPFWTGFRQIPKCGRITGKTQRFRYFALFMSKNLFGMSAVLPDMKDPLTMGFLLICLGSGLYLQADASRDKTYLNWCENTTKKSSLSKYLLDKQKIKG